MKKIKIKALKASQILASNGKPTLKVRVVLENGISETFEVPCGTSCGKKEAKELRDEEKNFFSGLGVRKAVQTIEEVIAPKLLKKEFFSEEEVDQILLELDGTSDKSNLGGNTMIGVSGAILKVLAKAKGLSLWQYLSQKFKIKPKIPGLVMNFINGGKHSSSPLKFQEHLLVVEFKKRKPSLMLKALNLAYLTFKNLKRKAEKMGKIFGVGLEGGLVLDIKDEMVSFKILEEALKEASNDVFLDDLSFSLGSDVAASSFYKNGFYELNSVSLNAFQMKNYLLKLIKKFSFSYLEDPFFEEDFESFEKLLEESQKKFKRPPLIVGDDLTVTCAELIEKAAFRKAISGVIIKPNQIGTMFETFEAISKARKFNLKIIVSHRSGETNDSFLADFAVGVGADLVKFGSIERGERVAKYNRLIEIEKQIFN